MAPFQIVQGIDVITCYAKYFTVVTMIGYLCWHNELYSPQRFSTTKIYFIRSFRIFL